MIKVLKGKESGFYQLLKKMKKAKIKLDDPKVLRSYYEYFSEDLDYFKIRLALSVIEKV